jgi:dihydropteroate synthase
MLSLKYFSELARQFPEDLEVAIQEFEIGNKFYRWNSQSYLMGVVNLSADSWYRESVCLDPTSAIQRGKVLAAQGASIIDVGAESTLANAARADVDRQCARLLPVVGELSAAGIAVSVESYRIEVARKCFERGAAVLNLTGTVELEEHFRLAAEFNAAVIVCYVQGRNVREVGDFKFSEDPILLLEEYFKRTIDLAVQCGVSKLLIDPGLGFYYRNLQDSSTRVTHQMKVFLNTFRLRKLGFPVCHALPHAFEFFGEEVRSAEPFFAVLAGLGQTSLFRTHEVSKTKAVLDTLNLFPGTGAK